MACEEALYDSASLRRFKELQARGFKVNARTILDAKCQVLDGAADAFG